MSDEPTRSSFEWRLHDLEEWRRELNRDGSPGLQILRERHEAAREQTREAVATLRERIAALERAQTWFLRSAIFITVSFVISILLWLVTNGVASPP